MFLNLRIYFFFSCLLLVGMSLHEFPKIKLYLYQIFFTRHYKRAFHELLSVKDTDIDKQSAVSDVSDYFRFGWLLFLALRVHAFSRFKDLVTCSNGLVSILVSYLLL